MQKQKILEFQAKNVLFGIFRLIIVIFGITTLDFAEIQKIMQNLKKANLGPNMPYFGIFGLEF